MIEETKKEARKRRLFKFAIRIAEAAALIFAGYNIPDLWAVIEPIFF